MSGGRNGPACSERMFFRSTRASHALQKKLLAIVLLMSAWVQLVYHVTAETAWVHNPCVTSAKEASHRLFVPPVDDVRSGSTPQVSATQAQYAWTTTMRQVFVALAVGFLMLVAVPVVSFAEDQASPATPMAAKSRGPTMRPLLSVGDLHGDYKATKFILEQLGVMDSSGQWAGGDTVLVQTGDVVDRGDESAEIWETLFRLQAQAPQSGGEVVLLLGNHELMNMEGDFRYATKKDTELLRAKAGLASRMAVFAPDGLIGQQLRSNCQTVALFGREFGLEKPVLYVHAGVLPEVAEEMRRMSGDGTAAAQLLNKVVLERLAGDQAAIRADTSPLFGDDGPFWTRHLALDSESGGACQDLQKSLDAFGAYRMVVGHTAQSDGKVHTRCGGRLVLADTLISAAYTGMSHPSALRIQQDGSAVAIYPGADGVVLLPNP